MIFKIPFNVVHLHFIKSLKTYSLAICCSELKFPSFSLPTHSPGTCHCLAAENVIGWWHMFPGKQTGSHLISGDPQNLSTLLLENNFSLFLPATSKMSQNSLHSVRFFFSLSVTYLALHPACSRPIGTYLTLTQRQSQDSSSMTKQRKGS